MKYKELKEENKKLWHYIELQNEYISKMAAELNEWHMQYYDDEWYW